MVPISNTFVHVHKTMINRKKKKKTPQNCVFKQLRVIFPLKI